MAKKVYHIPLQDTRLFIREHKTTLNRFLTDKQFLEYAKRFGKGYYDAQIEAFVTFFKIDRELSYALKTINHFSSAAFLEELFTLLNFSQFKCKVHHVSERDFFYGLCYVFLKENGVLFEKLIQKLFLHFHETLNNDSNIHIDYKEMATVIAASRKFNVKESFGEENKGAFFKLLLEGKTHVDERGQSIKTLRKKAYKKLFYYLLDNETEDAAALKRSEAHETMAGLKTL